MEATQDVSAEQQQVKTLTDRNAYLEKKLIDLQESLKAKDEESQAKESKLRKQVEQLAQDNENLSEEVTELQMDLTTALAERDQFASERNNFSAKLFALEENLKHFQDKTQENEQLKSKIAKLNKDLHQMSQASSQAVNRLRGTINSARREDLEIEEYRKGAELAIKRISDDLCQAQRDRDLLESHCEELSETIERKDQEIGKLKEAIAGLNAKLKESKHQNVRLEGEKLTLNTRLEAAQKEKKRLELRIAQKTGAGADDTQSDEEDVSKERLQPKNNNNNNSVANGSADLTSL